MSAENLPHNPLDHVRLADGDTPRPETMHGLNTIVINFKDERYAFLSFFVHSPQRGEQYQAYFDHPYTAGQLVDAGIPVIEGAEPSDQTKDLYEQYQSRRLATELGRFATEGYPQ